MCTYPPQWNRRPTSPFLGTPLSSSVETHPCVFWTNRTNGQQCRHRVVSVDLPRFRLTDDRPARDNRLSRGCAAGRNRGARVKLTAGARVRPITQLGRSASVDRRRKDEHDHDQRWSHDLLQGLGQRTTYCLLSRVAPVRGRLGRSDDVLSESRVSRHSTRSTRPRALDPDGRWP